MLLKQEWNNIVGKTCCKLLKYNFYNKIVLKNNKVMNVGKEFVSGILDVLQIREHYINLHAYYICITF